MEKRVFHKKTAFCLVLPAKSHCAEAAVTACERSIQVHGGVGFTWEHVLHRLYKRALGIQALEASGAQLRSEVAAHLLDGDGR